MGIEENKEVIIERRKEIGAARHDLGHKLTQISI